jgi:cysteine synthase
MLRDTRHDLSASTAPLSKVEATRRYGAEIRLVDGIYDDAYAASLAFRDETGALFLHPFDDEDVIAGQGTVALELLEQLPDVDAVVVPVGGGGLIAGIAYTVKTLCPSCRVYGVQADGADGMERVPAGKAVPLPGGRLHLCRRHRRQESRPADLRTSACAMWTIWSRCRTTRRPRQF